MGKRYLAIDIGASSGRLIIGKIKEDQLETEEIYRFKNGAYQKGDQLCWDLDYLVKEIKLGLLKCKDLGVIPDYIGIDTWGLDYVLLDKNDEVIGEAVSHRDMRTANIYDEIFGKISPLDLFKRTGVQMAEFNTICQLVALQRDNPEYLDEAKTMLMIPDYLNFRLTGIKTQEYTNASTTQLINPKTMKWDENLIKLLNLPIKIFQPIEQPNVVLGTLTKEVELELGFNCEVILVPGHDTASAFLAATEDTRKSIIISSGTWSLMGVENDKPVLRRAVFENKFTNEGGYDRKYMLLKNIMGLWLIQLLKKEAGRNVTFEELCELAEVEEIGTLIDCNDPSFMAPKSIMKAIDEYCQKTNQKTPENLGQYAKVIYTSLGMAYGQVADELESIMGHEFESINVIGGGAKANYLNRLIARHSGRNVIAGPFEATVLGNILAQMLITEEIEDTECAKDLIRRSFCTIEYSKVNI